jgi:hypothetical protein
MRPAWRVADAAIHLVLFAVAAAAMLWITTRVEDLTTRVALLSFVGLLAAVTLSGWISPGLGPVANSGAARIARLVGVVLAGSGVAIVADGLLHPGGSLFVRSARGIPSYAVGFAVYLAAFLIATRRDSGVPPRAALTAVGFGLVAAAVFAAAVPTLPPVALLVAYLLLVSASCGAAWLAQPDSSRTPVALLAVVTSSQAVFLVAAVLYHYGPDAWMPDAGPGPLTPQGQLDQNRAEAIDPYIFLLLLGLIAATTLVGTALSAWWRRTHGEAASAT